MCNGSFENAVIMGGRIHEGCRVPNNLRVAESRCPLCAKIRKNVFVQNPCTRLRERKWDLNGCKNFLCPEKGYEVLFLSIQEKSVCPSQFVIAYALLWCIMPFLLLLSGISALCCESVWLRRLSLITGSAGLSAIVTLGIYMGGLGLGGWWASRKKWSARPVAYGVMELCVALWAIAFPWGLMILSPLFSRFDGALFTLFCALPWGLPPGCMVQPFLR